MVTASRSDQKIADLRGIADDSPYVVRDEEMKRSTPSWKRPASGRALLALGALVSMAAALGCDRLLPGKPVAAELTATPQAVILIQEAKTRCVKVAKTG